MNPSEIEIVKKQQSWREMLSSIPKPLLFSEWCHIHLDFQENGVMKRLFLLSYFLARTSRTGHWLFFTWNANDGCPGYIRNVFDFNPSSKKFAFLGFLSPFWRIVDLTPHRSSASQSQASATPNCKKCLVGNKVQFYQLPNLPSLQEISFLPRPRSKTLKEATDFGELQEELQLSEKWGVSFSFDTLKFYFKFFFRTIPLDPDFRHQVLVFRNQFPCSHGIYLHKHIWNAKLPEEKEQKAKFLTFVNTLIDQKQKQKQKQEEKQNIFITTNDKQVQLDLVSKFGPKTFVFPPGELPLGDTKRVSAIEVTLQHCFWLSLCSQIHFFPEGTGTAKYFRMATFALWELLKQHPSVDVAEFTLR